MAGIERRCWERTLLGDPATLVAALIAVVLFGLSKGGLGGGFALVGVSVLAMVLPPVQAAALLLPVLLMMDAVGLWTWRGWYDRSVLPRCCRRRFWASASAR
jgi:uncharacterized protein